MLASVALAKYKYRLLVLHTDLVLFRRMCTAYEHGWLNLLEGPGAKLITPLYCNLS